MWKDGNLTYAPRPETVLTKADDLQVQIHTKHSKSSAARKAGDKENVAAG